MGTQYKCIIKARPSYDGATTIGSTEIYKCVLYEYKNGHYEKLRDLDTWANTSSESTPIWYCNIGNVSVNMAPHTISCKTARNVAPVSRTVYMSHREWYLYQKYVGNNDVRIQVTKAGNTSSSCTSDTEVYVCDTAIPRNVMPMPTNPVSSVSAFALDQTGTALAFIKDETTNTYSLNWDGTHTLLPKATFGLSGTVGDGFTVYSKTDDNDTVYKSQVNAYGGYNWYNFSFMNFTFGNQNANGVYTTFSVRFDIYTDNEADWAVLTGNTQPTRVVNFSGSTLNPSFKLWFIDSMNWRNGYPDAPNTYDSLWYDIECEGTDNAYDVLVPLSEDRTKEYDGVGWGVVTSTTVTRYAGDGTAHTVLITRTPNGFSLNNGSTPSAPGTYTVTETFTLVGESGNQYQPSISSHTYTLSITGSQPPTPTCVFPQLKIKPLNINDGFDNNVAFTVNSTVDSVTESNTTTRYIAVRCVLSSLMSSYPSKVRILACRKDYNISPSQIPSLFSANDSSAYLSDSINATDHLTIDASQNKYCMYITCDTPNTLRSFRYWEANFPILEQINQQNVEVLNKVGVEIPYTFYAWTLPTANCESGAITKAQFPAIQRIIQPSPAEANNIFLVDTACDDTVLSDSYTGRGASWDSNNTEHNFYNALYFAQHGDTILFSGSLVDSNTVVAPVISDGLSYDIEKGVIIDARKPYKVVNNNIVEDTDTLNWFGVEFTNGSGHTIFDVDVNTNKPFKCYNLIFTESGTSSAVGYGCEHAISAYSPTYLEGCKFHQFEDYAVWSFDTVTIRGCYFNRNGRTYSDNEGSYSIGGGVWLRLSSEVSSSLFLNNANALRDGHGCYVTNNTILFDESKIGANDIESLSDTSFGMYYWSNCHNNFVAGYPMINGFVDYLFMSENNIVLCTDANVNAISNWSSYENYDTIFGSNNAYSNEIHFGFGSNGSGCPTISNYLNVLNDYTPIYNENAVYTVVDRGNNDFVASMTDYIGKPRIYGSTVDIGCYEYYPSDSLPVLSVTTAQSFTFDGLAHYVLAVTGNSSNLISSATLCVLSDDFDYTSYDGGNNASLAQLEAYITSEADVYSSTNIPKITHVADTGWSGGKKVIVSVPGYQSWVGTISATITARPITVSNSSVSYIQKLY